MFLTLLLRPLDPVLDSENPCTVQRHGQSHWIMAACLCAVGLGGLCASSWPGAVSLACRQMSSNVINDYTIYVNII